MKRFIILCLVLLCAVPFASAITGTCTLGGTAIPGHDGPMACDGNVDTWAISSDTGTAHINVTFPSNTTVFSATIYNNGDTSLATHTYNVYFGLDPGNATYNCTAVAGASCTVNVASIGVETYRSVYFSQHTGTWANWSEVSVTGYNDTYSDLIPVVDFTGSPTAGVPPMLVSFTDNSTNEIPGSTTYNWTITPSTNVSGSEGTGENHIATFVDPGNYTVSHGVSTPYGSGNLTKTDYIWVYAANETETTYFYTYNPLSGYEIHNSNIYLNDIENGSWVNSTNDADGRLGITALSTHHINAYSDKEGFGDGELLNQIANGLSYPLIMFPSNVSNVSAGNVTLYINVIDTWAPGTPVSGATVSITYAWPAIQYGTTNEAGMISFTAPNNTLIQVAANKAGYTGVSDSVNSGTGSGGEASVSKTLYITKKTITTAPTPTTLPGGGTPTPQVTYLPHCDPSAADYDAAQCRTSKGGMGLNILADNLEGLIWICIIVTVIYLFKGIGK